MALVIYVYSSQAGWTLPADIMQKLPSTENLWIQGNQVYDNIVIKVKDIIGFILNAIQ
jgi:hypothetical protein